MFGIIFCALFVVFCGDEDGAFIASGDIVGGERIVLSSPGREVLAPRYCVGLSKGFGIEKGNEDLVLSFWRCHCRIELGGL